MLNHKLIEDAIMTRWFRLYLKFQHTCKECKIPQNYRELLIGIVELCDFVCLVDIYVK